MRWRLVVGAVAALLAVGSAVHAGQRESDVDRQAREKALAAVSLDVSEQLDSVGIASSQRFYPLPVSNSGSQPLVVVDARWRGDLTVRADRQLDPGERAVLLLPQPPCPTRTVTGTVRTVSVRVAAGGGQRVLELAVPDPELPDQELNLVCGLQSATNMSSAVQVTKAARGSAVVEVALSFGGRRPTDVLAVESARGVELALAKKLPLRVSPAPLVGDGLLQRTFTATLRLRDCSALGDQWFQLALTVQHPGDVVEHTVVTLPTAEANRFAAPCGVTAPEQVDY